jgi:hypothetical protein
VTTYKYPLPFVEGTGFAIVGGTVQLAVNQDGAAGTYELDDDAEDMVVQAYFRVDPEYELTAADDPDDGVDDEDDEDVTDIVDDDEWASDEDDADTDWPGEETEE